MRSSTRTVGVLACAAAAVGFAPVAAVAATPLSTTSTPMCATSQLTAELGGGDAGAGNLYRYLVLTNHSKTTCHVTGFPGLSMLDAKGKQIGNPATRQQIAYSAVVLAPGKSASDTIHTANRQTNSGTECLPTSTSLRIYPPGNTASLVFPGKVTNCDKLFSVTPFAAGTSGNPSSTVPASGTGSSAAPVTAAPSQVASVPKGAPDTGLALTSTSGSDDGTAIVAGAAGGALLLVGFGALVLRPRSRRQAESRVRG